MATENILVRLGLDPKRYIDGANKAERATSGVQSAVLGFAKAAAGAFSAQQLVQFAGDSIRAFSDLEESINAVEVQFDEGADRIKAFGEVAAETVGLSNAEFNQLSVTTGALLSNFIEDTDAAAEETVKLTRRAADMASVFNTDVEDALLAVQAALRGEQEPIRKFGVLIDEAAVNARALELGLADTAKEIGVQEKAVARLSLIYEQTDKTAGDFAATSDSLANSQKILGARFEDTQAEVGKALAPAFVALLDAADSLLPVLEDLAPVVGDLATSVADLVNAAEPAVGIIGRLARAAGAYAREGQVAAGLAFWADTEEDVSRLGETVDAVIPDLSAAVQQLITDYQDYAVRAEDATQSAEAWAQFQDQAAASANNFDQGLDNLRSSVIETAEAERRAAARADELKGAYNRLESQTRKQADSQERANQALIDFQKRSLEAASPALQLLRAQERVTAAQEAANSAVKDFGPDSAEARDATIDLFEAQLELEGATLNAKGKVNDAEQALKDLAGPLGISEDLVRDLIEALDDLPTVTDLDVNVRFNQTGDNPGVSVPSSSNPGPGNPGGPGDNVFLDAPVGFTTNGTSVQLFMEAPPDTDTFDQVSLALQLSGITEEIEMNPSFR